MVSGKSVAASAAKTAIENGKRVSLVSISKLAFEKESRWGQLDHLNKEYKNRSSRTTY
jgi:hypothetical protein